MLAQLVSQSIQALDGVPPDGIGLARTAMHKLMLAYFSICWASRLVGKGNLDIPKVARQAKTAKVISATNRLFLAYEDVRLVFSLKPA